MNEGIRLSPKRDIRAESEVRETDEESAALAAGGRGGWDRALS
jgi:hypothetical protein